MSSSLPSPAELDQLVPIDPEIHGIIKNFPRPATEVPDHTTYVHRLREGYVAMADSTPHPQVQEESTTYVNRDGHQQRILIFKPAVKKDSLPLFVFYHGGGGCIGTPELSSAYYRDFVLDHQCVVAAPQYRLAPEHKYPACSHDAWDALKHIAANADEYGADPTAGFIIGGESFGALLSAVTMLQARDARLSPPITGAWLSAGSYVNPYDVPAQYQDSYRSRFDPTCLNSTFLSKTQKVVFDACLQPDYSSPLYRASLWPTGQEGLPKTYFQACGFDINRDDSYIYRDMLVKAGVETRLDVYPGCPHCFWYMCGETAQGRKWKEDTRQSLAWLFGK